LGDLLFDEVDVGTGRKIGEAVLKVVEGSGVVAFAGQDYGEELLGDRLSVQRIDGERLDGVGFGNVLLTQIEVGKRTEVPKIRGATRVEK
jgi:hypothetical protein